MQLATKKLLPLSSTVQKPPWPKIFRKFYAITTTVSATRHRANNKERLFTIGNFFWQNRLGRFKRQIFFADEVADEWPALQCPMVANCSLQNRKLIFKRI